MQTLLEAARKVDDVLADPAPQVAFEHFGDRVMRFRIYPWIAAPPHTVRMSHELHMVIERLFRASGITIESPQQDVHLYPQGPIEVRLGIDSAAAHSAVGGRA